MVLFDIFLASGFLSELMSIYSIHNNYLIFFFDDVPNFSQTHVKTNKFFATITDLKTDHVFKASLQN